MDDYHLTYKIEDLYGSQLNQLYFSIAINDVSISFELLSKNVVKFLEEITNAIHEMMQNFPDGSGSNDYQCYINCRRKLFPVKCIKPTHDTPVYKIIPKVRNRC